MLESADDCSRHSWLPIIAYLMMGEYLSDARGEMRSGNESQDWNGVKISICDAGGELVVELVVDP